MNPKALHEPIQSFMFDLYTIHNFDENSQNQRLKRSKSVKNTFETILKYIEKK